MPSRPAAAEVFPERAAQVLEGLTSAIDDGQEDVLPAVTATRRMTERFGTPPAVCVSWREFTGRDSARQDPVIWMKL